MLKFVSRGRDFLKTKSFLCAAWEAAISVEMLKTHLHALGRFPLLGPEAGRNSTIRHDARMWHRTSGVETRSGSFPPERSRLCAVRRLVMPRIFLVPESFGRGLWFIIRDVCLEELLFWLDHVTRPTWSWKPFKSCRETCYYSFTRE
jgi:hypothetical protein